MNAGSRFRLGIVAALAWSAGTPWLMAQEPPVVPAAPAAAAVEEVEYKVIAIPPAVWNGAPSKAIQNLEKKEIPQILRGDIPYAANEATFTKYYTLYRFPLMTQTSPEQLANLHKERTTFFRDHFNHSKKSEPGAKEPHDKLVDLTFKFMKPIAVENYHPAVRYNAMLIIADLNAKEGQNSGGSQAPAEPLPEARDFMLAEATNPRQIDAVRLAALLGLLRHAEHNAMRPAERQWPAAVRAGIVKQLIPLATDKKVTPTQTPEGHAWLRGRAVETLAAIGKVAPDPTIVQTITQIIGDDTEPLSLRLVAADALGRMNLAGGNLTGTEVGRKLADLSLASSKATLATLDAEIAEIRAIMKKEGGGGSIGGPLTTIETYVKRLETNINEPSNLKRQARLKLVCKQLKDSTMRITHGLRGEDGTLGAMSAAKAAPQKDYVNNVLKSVAAISKVADLKANDPTVADRLELLVLAKELRSNIAALDTVAKTGGPPPAAVAPAAPEVPGELPDVPGAAVVPPAARPAALPVPAAELPDVPAGN